MVRFDLGTAPLRDVLVDPLDLGHDILAIPAQFDFLDCFATPKHGKLADIRRVRSVVGTDGSGQSLLSVIPSLLSVLDLAATLQAGARFPPRIRDCSRRDGGLPEPLACPKLQNVW